MKVKVAICDDEKESLDAIQKELYQSAEKLKINIETDLYTSGTQVIEEILKNEEKYDLLFLDIDMPEISGLEVAKKLREHESKVMLIFISAHEQYVFESIDYQPFKYIRKIKMKEEIELALKRACQSLEKENTKNIIVRTKKGEAKIDCEDIMYLETYLRKISIYTKDGKERKLIGRKSIKEMLGQLGENFVQVHSGGVVNLKYVKEYSGNDLILDNGKKINVSRSRIKEVKAEIARYWGGKVW